MVKVALSLNARVPIPLLPSRLQDKVEILLVATGEGTAAALLNI